MSSSNLGYMVARTVLHDNEIIFPEVHLSDFCRITWSYNDYLMSLFQVSYLYSMSGFNLSRDSVQFTSESVEFVDYAVSYQYLVSNAIGYSKMFLNPHVVAAKLHMRPLFSNKLVKTINEKMKE